MILALKVVLISSAITVDFFLLNHLHANQCKVLTTLTVNRLSMELNVSYTLARN